MDHRSDNYHQPEDQEVAEEDPLLHSGYCQREQSNFFFLDQDMEPRKQESWEDLNHPVKMAYNSSVHSGTGQTPFYLWHGREMMIPIDLQFSCTQERYASTSYFAIKMEQ